VSDLEETRGILASSAVMATGTIFSRASGYVRNVLLAAAIGNELHADLFNIGNTIPNMLYILLAGGVFNAVLVPQLVRAQKSDQDRGEAYTNRVITLAVLFLGAVTVILVLAAPLVMRLYLNGAYDDPALAAQRDSAITFARYCLPQVFFYGMFVLLGQVLNARGRFGPMMWAPIANNVIAILVLVLYLFWFGALDSGAGCTAFTPAQELVLGGGATLGIIAQVVVLLPVLRAAGVRFRPRYDFRRTGLGHTLRLGIWTVLFVVVNQVAYTVVVRLASGGTAHPHCGVHHHADATGYTVYASAFLFVMVPHAIVTVSLATAILPRLSAKASDGDLTGLAGTLAGTLRTALAVVIPFAFALPLLAYDAAKVLFGYLATSDGLPLRAMISVPLEATGLAIDRDGVVSATVDGEGAQQLGQIDLVTIKDFDSLSAIGGGFYEAAEDIVINGDNPGAFVQGSLESSNVRLSDEMVSLLLLQRAFAANAQVVQAGDQLMSIVNTLRR